MASFRAFLDDLERYGELKTIEEEVDWDLQASAICAMSQRVGGPAVKMTKVRDYPGVPLVGAVFSGPGFAEWPQQARKMHGRIAIGLGLEPSVDYDELMETISERKKSLIRAMELEGGPCQEVVIQGKDVNLYGYPIPRIHDKDGGRYLAYPVVITADPETGATNFGMYRLMLAGRNRLVHGRTPRLTTPPFVEQLVQKYHQRGEAVPFAIAIGAPPAITMTSCLDMPPGSPQYALAGGLGLSPITLIKAKLSDLLVPADAEIILEGHIYPGEKAEEGPFASISFYMEKMESFVYQVELITQRAEPILPFVAEGAGPSDTTCLFSVMHSGEMMELCRRIGVPVRWVTMPVETKLVLGVVSLSFQPVPGLPARAAGTIFGKSPFIRQLIFVDGDVDSENFITSVMTDKTYKAHPSRGYHISSRADKPIGLTENHDWQGGLTSTAFIDATWRMDRPAETKPRRVSFEVCFPEEIQDKIIQMWNEELKLTPRAWKYKT
jgi:4-hydroxy-3-polyprenylbenzoate decarboxylase